MCAQYTPCYCYSVQCTPLLTTSWFIHSTVNSEGDDIVAKARVVYKPPKCAQVGQRDGDIREALVDLHQDEHDSDFEVTAVTVDLVDNKDGATVGAAGAKDTDATSGDAPPTKRPRKGNATAKRPREDPSSSGKSPVAGRTRLARAAKNAIPTGNTPVSGHTRSRGMSASIAGKQSSGKAKASPRVTRSAKFLPFRSCLLTGDDIANDDGSIYYACRPKTSGGMLYIEKALTKTPSMEEWYQIFRDNNNKPVIRRFNNSLDTKVFKEMLQKDVPRWVNLLEMLSTYDFGYPKLQVKARLTLHPVGLFTVCIAHPVEFRTCMTYPVHSTILSTCYRSRKKSLVN